ncbi:MAG: dienelactone hydrolase family protein [Thermomicrobiales bacterium]
MNRTSRDIGRTDVTIPSDSIHLAGTYSEPRGARGVVLFAHGSGSSRHSPRNKTVAAELEAAGFATLLLDLLTVKEEQIDEITREYRFDIPMLGERLISAIDWLASHGWTAPGAIGLFGASTGAGAALIAAAARPEAVGAAVSRGGRPDLAGAHLAAVRAPTLMIVGSRDEQVIDLNRQAMAAMTCPVHLAIVPGATHLFEEPGTMSQVIGLARDWFLTHLGASRQLTSAR